MATRVAWFLNLDVERELAHPARYRPSSVLIDRADQLIARMSLLLRPDDDILFPGEAKLRPRSLSRAVLCFCPSPWALSRLRDMNLPAPPSPGLQVLRRVSSRAFNAQVGQTVPGARYALNAREVEQALATPSPTGTWVLKQDYGFTGRGRLWLRENALTPRARRFVDEAFARGEGIQVEPWLTRTADFSRHGYLEPSGELHVGPIVQQWTSARGAWQRSALADEQALNESEQHKLAFELHNAGQRLHEAGYFGPFGIDAFRYQLGASRQELVARIEINARFSMGYPRSLLERALLLQPPT